MKYLVNGTKIATLIIRNGKDELRVYNIDKNGGTEVVASIILDGIIDFIWASQTSRKKRTSNGSNKESKDSDILVVLLKNNDFVIISQESEINRFNIGEEIKKLVHFDEYLWATSTNDKILKISLTGQVKEQVHAPSFTTIDINKKTVALGSSDLKIGKISRGKFVSQSEITLDEKVTKIIQGEHMVALTNDKNAYLIQDPIQKIAGDINHIQFLNYQGKDYILAINNSIYFYNGGKLENTIASDRSLMGVVCVENSLVAFWEGTNELLFKLINWNDQEISIPNGSAQLNGSGSRAHIEVPHHTKVKEIDSESLLKSLNKQKDSASIIELCSAVNDAAVVKDVTKQIGLELFPTINEGVIKDATNANLALWLKWILLFYGGHISTQQDTGSVKNLKSQLENGSKLIPHLVSIKGKLQLLKLQNEMRKKSPVGEVTTTIEDDSLIYVNGEAE
ncbi:conserved hypothetical protein [Candida tropicalis MYA-3404]|uniref:Small-subunit processome Utp12 domain-containing protein n=1 Tax=Candida tropicalis (strain ATCC MYA-3404 / T1) TaxID=294747 RepID=C5MHN6_CANTT|nr:conserved hypothetical protein [Candida tropicalis MYA-3404]EER30583.1 conserved hypothetical protein [Candida tropicalis MYA-3404]KAG4409348.1 hypothetical protein JTP64_002654 [Candida tropicalis]MCP8717888.1 Utp12 domain-containing protein [Asgard group archaeon]